MLWNKQNVTSGFFLSRRNSTQLAKTYVVLGAPRGGTSMPAGAMRLAGIFMGDDLDPANNEDQAFNFHKGNLLGLTTGISRQNYLDSIRRTIKYRNATHRIWGWKDPLAALYIEEVIADLINPHVIFVSRDITAAVLRERNEVTKTLKKAEEQKLYFEKTKQALDLYIMASSIIEKTGLPTFFVSYEKARRHPEMFATQLLEFTGAIDLSKPEGKSFIEAIKLYAHDGAFSADIANRPTPIIPNSTGTDDTDLTSYVDLPSVYHRCATLINLRHYEQGLLLAKSVLVQIILGFRSYPHLNNNEIVVAEVEAGMCFMSAIAEKNLGNTRESYCAIGRYFAISRFLSITRHSSSVLDGISKHADALLRSLETELVR